MNAGFLKHRQYDRQLGVPYPFCGKLATSGRPGRGLGGFGILCHGNVCEALCSKCRLAVWPTHGWLLPHLEGKILKMPFVPVKRNSYGKQISRHGGLCGGISVAEKIAEFIKTSTEKSHLVPRHSEVDRFFQEQAALAAAMEASYV